MPLNVTKELAALQNLSVGDLRERYTQLFQETTQARNRPWLIKRIIWRMQSLEQGGLSERALLRANELAASSDLRVTAPKARCVTDGATTRTIECSVAPSRTAIFKPPTTASLADTQHSFQLAGGSSHSACSTDIPDPICITKDIANRIAEN